MVGLAHDTKRRERFHLHSKPIKANALDEEEAIASDLET